MKLNGKAMGLAAGIVWGGCILLVGLAAATRGIQAGSSWYGKDFLLAMASVYPGYTGTPEVGASVIGGLYGFVDGFIAGYLFAWIYNRVAPS